MESAAEVAASVRGDRWGVNPIWLTLFFLFITFSLSTGLLAVYTINIPFPLDPEGIAYYRVRTPGHQPSPLQASIVVLLLPVAALEAAPLSVLLHVLALSVLYTATLERCLNSSRYLRATAVGGLLIALTAPLPGAYSYTNPFPQVITLWPSTLVGIILFFSHPLVRVLLPALAYSLPMTVLFLTRRPPATKRRAGGQVRASPAPPLLLASLMGLAVIMVLTDVPVLQVLGLAGNWAIMVAGLLLWTLRYRPSLNSLKVHASGGLEVRLYSFRKPGPVVVVLTLLILFVTLSPQVDEVVESRASFHHLQHLALLVAGLLQGGAIYQLARAHRRHRGLVGSLSRFIYVTNVIVNPRGLSGTAAAAAFLAAWHVPYLWDLALMNDGAHALEHASVIIAGASLAFSLPLMRPSFKYGLILGAAILMSLLTLSLWVAEIPVYSTYPLWQLQELGMYHFLLGMPLTWGAFAAAASALLGTTPPGGSAS